MVRFPEAFAEKVEPISKTIGKRGNASLTRLEDENYLVVTGLTRYFAGAISVMAGQPHIREFCPKDATSQRFLTEISTERFLGENGGRAMFLLLSQVIEDADTFSGQLDGYAWTERAQPRELPNHPIASAYRIGAHAAGRGLAKDFVQTVVSATHTLYAPDEGIGLQVWETNFATHIYEEVGFRAQPNPNQKPQFRPTLDINAESGLKLDTRLYMAYDSALLD